MIDPVDGEGQELERSNEHGGGETIDALVRTVQAQTALIEQLQARLEVVEGAATAGPEHRTSTPAPATATAPEEPAAVTVLDATTSRRQLMSRGAAMAAGAMVVGTAVTTVSASPAAAASGTFDGNPAISAAAFPDSTTAIVATTATGVAIHAQATSTGPTGAPIAVWGEANSGAGTGVKGAATAASGDTVGVLGTAASSSGVGIKGVATATSGPAHGVYGTTSSAGANGVTGFATHASSGTGVAGRSDSGSGVGVFGRGRWGVVAFGTSAQLNLQGTAPVPVTTTNPYAAGDIVFDPAGDLWLCIASGSPGTWRRISGTNTAGALSILPAPVRVYDSRASEPPFTGLKAPLDVRVPRPVDCTANGSGLPAGATAAMVNVIAVNHAEGGFVSVYKDGVPFPGTSNLNFEANLVSSVTTVTALSASGRCALYANHPTDVVVDVIGFYR